MSVKYVEDALEKSPFGLTTSEIAKKTGMNERTVLLFLEKLAADKKVKKTKSGRAYFYKSLKCTKLKASFCCYVIIFSFIVITTASAQDMNSTTFKVLPVVAGGGGDSQGITFKVSGKLGQPVSGKSNSISFDLCSGFICNFIDIIINSKVTFLLEFSISGSGNDTVFADNETSLGQYRASQLSNYYACLHDANLTNSPIFGIIFAGSSLNYLNISSNVTPGNSFSMRVSQDIPGNEFILPITHNNCTIVNTRLEEIGQFGTILHPFIALAEALNAVELALGYPNIDIVGSFDRTGAFTLVMEKNDTDETQIVIRPV